MILISVIHHLIRLQTKKYRQPTWGQSSSILHLIFRGILLYLYTFVNHTDTNPYITGHWNKSLWYILTIEINNCNGHNMT